MDKFKRSLLHKSLRGKVLVYSGQYGAGKTLASMLDPSNTFFIDADHLKGKELSEQNPGMVYWPVNSDDREDLVKTGEMFLDAVTKIDKSKTTVVVIDNIYEIEQGLHAYAIANPMKLAKMYNLVSGHISSRNYGHDTLAHERVIKGVVDELLIHEVTVVIISHMKPKFMVPGQMEIKARKWIYEAASLVAIMQRTNAAPDALIFKNAFNYHVAIDVSNLSDEDFELYRNGDLESSKILQRVPRRIPAYSPSKLARYLSRSSSIIEANPYKPEETLTDEDIMPYSEMLTKWQLANLEKIMDAEQEERERFIDFENNIKESRRVELDQTILDAEEMEMPKLLAILKSKFDIFAAEITPVYIMQVKQRG